MYRARIIRGDTSYLDLEVTLPPAATPVDLTGSMLWFVAKRSPESAAEITKTSEVGGGIILTEPDQGRARITLDPADTSDFEERTTRLVYDVQLRTPTGAIYTIAQGQLLVVMDYALAV